jgi:hypothetical protein
MQEIANINEVLVILYENPEAYKGSINVMTERLKMLEDSQIEAIEKEKIMENNHKQEIEGSIFSEKRIL